jgi:hypothetical protein
LKYYYSFNDHWVLGRAALGLYPTYVSSQYSVLPTYSLGHGSGFVTIIHDIIIVWTMSIAVVVIIIRMVFVRCFDEVDFHPHIDDRV